MSLDGLLLEPSLLSQLDEAGLPAPRGTPRSTEGWVYAPGCESYRGDRLRTGCVRVAWRHAPLGEVSLLARDFASEGFTLEGFSSEGRRLGPWQARGGGYELAMLLRGRHSASDMMARAAQADAASFPAAPAAFLLPGLPLPLANSCVAILSCVAPAFLGFRVGEGDVGAPDATRAAAAAAATCRCCAASSRAVG